MAGNEVQSAYDEEYGKDPSSRLIVTPPGALRCKRIFFLRWELNSNDQTPFCDLMPLIARHMRECNFTSIAFPAVECARDGCPVDIAAKTIIKEMASQLLERNLSWRVKFVVPVEQKDLYRQLCEQVAIVSDVKGNHNHYKERQRFIT